MNMNTLLVVADAARARLFRLATTDSPRAPVVLQEADSLVHPESRIKEGDRYSGSSASGTRSGKAGQGHILDDHREAHDTEERRRFSKAIAQSVHRVAKENANNPVILIATHAVHSFVLSELERELPSDIYVRSEIGELTELAPPKLLAEVERRGLFQP